LGVLGGNIFGESRGPLSFLLVTPNPSTNFPDIPFFQQSGIEIFVAGKFNPHILNNRFQGFA
jgi:hypothetical protein